MSGESSSTGADGGGDDGGGTVGEMTTDEFMLKIKRCPQPLIGHHYYRMQSDPRGFCLIFNIFEFPNTEYDIRKGSETEAKNLSSIFEELHFISKVFDNPFKKDIESTVDEYSEKPELSGHDAIVIIVLSHGKSDGFIASDGQYIAFKDIVDKLNNKNCTKLIDKPKLFFFSCCRGEFTDPGVCHTIPALEGMHLDAMTGTIPLSTPESESNKLITKLFPTTSDMMICYSTVDGFVSWRCEETGTWLGDALYKTLLKHSHNMGLLQMLTEISNAVDDRTTRAAIPAKQVIEVILRGFKRSFYFNPGYIVKEGEDFTEEGTEV